jgi:hypothetical protein
MGINGRDKKYVPNFCQKISREETTKEGNIKMYLKEIGCRPDSKWFRIGSNGRFCRFHKKQGIS